MERVTVFDTTLRDGEQSPGAGMSPDGKLQIALALEELGVDVIEAGFPAASPGDFDAVRLVAGAVRTRVAALARCTRDDIERAADALRDAARPRLHVFLATSAIHRTHKLRMAREEILRRTSEAVTLARTLCDDVEFSPEDASRTEPDFLFDVVEAAIAAGAATINVPDTVGYATPAGLAGLFRALTARFDAVFSVHCHDDLGLATANSLAALEAGARQVEVTVNGIGERAGNAALEEVVMALKTRGDAFGLETGIRTERLGPVSKLVANVTGLAVPRHKAVVGRNAFAHEAGIHQHGVLAHRATYEIMRPDDVGFTAESIVLGKHSGRHAIRARAEALGYRLDDAALDRVFAAFKELADRKKEVYDDDLAALMAPGSAGWELVSVRSTSGSTSSAAVRLRHEGRVVEETAHGDGPVDATLKAIARATGVAGRLRDYGVRSVSVGEDAQGEASVEIEHRGRTWRGRGASTDVVEASARAYVDAVNRILEAQRGVVCAVGDYIGPVA
jgi:2-isopropylmalate synthase